MFCLNCSPTVDGKNRDDNRKGQEKQTTNLVLWTHIVSLQSLYFKKACHRLILHSLITALQIKTPRARTLAHTHYSLSPWYNRKQWNKGPFFWPSDCHLPAIAVHSLEDGTEKTNKRVSAREAQEKGGQPVFGDRLQHADKSWIPYESEEGVNISLWGTFEEKFWEK